MIVGYHAIFSMYGFWLPNDPRGSWSDFVGNYELYRAGGKATKTDETCSLARRPHDRAKRLAVKQELERPPVKLTGIQARAVGRGFANYVQKSGLTVWACAILPDHVHLVVAKFRYKIETVVNFLKGQATGRLIEEGIHPFRNEPRLKNAPPKCFAQGEWKVFLDPPDVRRAIRYVEDNPLKEGLPRQRWTFVTPYQG
jgi:REP element-mobilizing transposase RayT